MTGKLWLFLFLALGLSRLASADELRENFIKPPEQAKPQTWWHWMNGNVTKEGITADLEAMKRVGLGGATMFQVDQDIPAGPIGYMTPQWLEMVKHAAREADRLGLALCMHNCAGWSSSGGPWITPEHAMQRLSWTETPVTGPAHFNAALSQPQVREGYYRDIAVLAYRVPAGDRGETSRIPHLKAKIADERADRLQPDVDPAEAALPAVPRDKIVDLTAKLTPDGHLAWDAPEGKWTIVRLGYTPTGARNAPAPPEGCGLECDKLSTDSLTVHWNGIMTPLIAKLGPLAGKALNNVLIDSYEMGCQNWTPRFIEEFTARRGYDPRPLLVVLTGRVVDSAEVSERFLWDFRRTIADLYADHYYGYFSELCHKNGFKASIEPYGNGPFDNLQSAALADVIMGEFWVNGAAIETVKLAAAAAHTNGQAIVGAESFTAIEEQGRWTIDPYSIKALGDKVFCAGVNRTIIHRFAMQPWLDKKPGMTMGPWGTHFDRTVTWWEQGAAWLAYLARCQSLLQAGRFAADALYFTGEEGPNDMTSRRALQPALPAGYDYDGCDARTMLGRMTVKDGRITLASGMSYRVLVLPPSRFMSPAMLRKIRELVKDGATVVGPRPEQSPSLAGYPQCDAEVTQLAGDLWGNCDGKTVMENRLGQGRIVWGKPLEAVFGELGVKPDFIATGAQGKSNLAYIHRIAGDTDIYFVSNQRPYADRVRCAFRVAGKTPELWRPDQGTIQAAPIYEEQDGRTTVTLDLDPAGSAFVVFRPRPAVADHLVALTRTGDKPVHRATPPIKITKAHYGTDDGRGADVTAEVAAMVANGQEEIMAVNESFGDSVPTMPKRLKVEYTLAGKPQVKTVNENGSIDLFGGHGASAPPDYDLTVNAKGQAELTPWQAGVYSFQTALGKIGKIQVKDAARTLKVGGAWTLGFPPKLGAPESVRLKKLISWTDHGQAGVRYFSGTAVYRKKLEIPAKLLGPDKVVNLDLGRVKNFAEVILNGRNLGVLWKEPFRLDITKVAKPGTNSLEIRVTNLWPNRLIGDEQLPDDCEWVGHHLKGWPEWLAKGKPRPSSRLTFATWRYYTRDSPLLESGLIGPVTLRAAGRVPVQ